MPKRTTAVKREEGMDDFFSMVNGKMSEDQQQRKVAQYVLAMPELYSEKAISWAQEIIIRHMMGMKIK